MFHSFGLTLATTLPILLGLRVVHHPDPTDLCALRRLSRKYRPTYVLATPTLLSYMFESGTREDFQSYRFFIIGAGGEGPGAALPNAPVRFHRRPRSWKGTGSPNARRL